MIAKKLIEVVMPIREVSAESVRDKSIRHGHISTLHLWWARRPLPICRAVVFTSLVPDPDDPACAPVFQEAVRQLLGPLEDGRDPYKPYDDIPYTSAHDPMADTLRNRLLMFIGKYSDAYIDNVQLGKPDPAAGKLLSDFSLVKWETRRNPTILNKARKLIFVAHNAETGKGVDVLTGEFDQLLADVRQAEKTLYQTTDRHVPSADVEQKQTALQTAIDAFLDRMPRVFDPFAGGGAIPLEAARLGCRTFGNDINPVAHVIQRGSLEFPQRFGKPITYSKAEFLRLYPTDKSGIKAGDAMTTDVTLVVGSWAELQSRKAQLFSETCTHVTISNRLSFDVDYYARKLLAITEDEVGHLYPKNALGRHTVAYYWARTATCANPSCRSEVPLLKSFYLSKKRTAKASDYTHLRPIIIDKEIGFTIEKREYEKEGFVQNRKNLKCPVCGNITETSELKRQFNSGSSGLRLLAVIDEHIVQKSRVFGSTEINSSVVEKYYRKATQHEIDGLASIEEPADRPVEPMPVDNTKQFDLCTWGFTEYGQMFSRRQLKTLLALVDKLGELKDKLLKEYSGEYFEAISTYLGIWIDRIAARGNAFCVWHVLQEIVEHPFGRQAIPMVLDYPELNPFSNNTGAALGQLEAVVQYVENESEYPFAVECRNASSGDVSQFLPKFLDAVITDPPYYDAIAYADLSDFFYVWLKRTLADVYPFNFAFPQTPKTEECTALKHHHNGSLSGAKLHFEQKLRQIFSAIEKQTKGIVSIMFAHQSTEAWTTLCNSILGSNMNITGSWAIDSEQTSALKAGKSFLESSVTVSCRPVGRTEIGEYNSVRREIGQKVAEEVELLYKLGFRGSDLLTACFGQAVSVFGHYDGVQRLSGEGITVAELLTLARESAFNSLVGGFEADDLTRFYLAWLQLHGFTESDFDEVNKLAKVGLQVDTRELINSHLLWVLETNKRWPHINNA